MLGEIAPISPGGGAGCQHAIGQPRSTAGWYNRLSYDGGIIYVQGPEQTTARYVRVIPNWVAKMKAAVNSANQ
jgi:hypothetical protein